MSGQDRDQMVNQRVAWNIKHLYAFCDDTSFTLYLISLSGPSLLLCSSTSCVLQPLRCDFIQAHALPPGQSQAATCRKPGLQLESINCKRSPLWFIRIWPYNSEYIDNSFHSISVMTVIKVLLYLRRYWQLKYSVLVFLILLFFSRWIKDRGLLEFIIPSQNSPLNFALGFLHDKLILSRFIAT